MQVFMNNPPLKRILMKICKFLLFQNLKTPIRPNNQNSFKFQSFLKFFQKFKLLNILMCLKIILIYHIKFTYYKFRLSIINNFKFSGSEFNQGDDLNVDDFSFRK